MKKTLKNFFMMLTIALLISSCKPNKEKVITETVTNYLTKQMKNPESFKIVSLVIRNDTLPYFLSDDILNKAEEASEALSKFNRYANMSYLFAEEKYTSAKEAQTAKDELIELYNIYDDTPADIKDVAYVTHSGTNPMGGRVSSSTIIIIDPKDPTKILGTFHIDEDFIKQFITIKMLCEDFEFKKNKYGKYETDDMPYIEQFIMNDAE